MLSITAYPPMSGLEILRLLKPFPEVKGAVVYDFEAADQLKMAGLRVGLFLGLNHEIPDTSYLNSPDYIFIGDEPNITGPSGAYIAPVEYIRQARVAAQILRDRGYKGHIVMGCMALNGQTLKKYNPTLDTGYLAEVVALGGHDCFDAYGVNPFCAFNIEGITAQMRAVVGDKPLYAAGFGWVNPYWWNGLDEWWYQEWGNAWGNQLRSIVKAGFETFSVWNLQAYHDAWPNRWGLVYPNGNLTYSGGKLRKALDGLRAEGVSV